nr:DUF2577 family protein [uncultured Butyricicoccus sp.]
MMNDTYSSLTAAVNPRTDPVDGFAIGFVTALAPLTVQLGEQTYYGDEITLARQLTTRTEQVTVDWQTQPETCTAVHRHAIVGTFEMTVHSPLKVGQRVLVLPKSDQQSIYLVDILP